MLVGKMVSSEVDQKRQVPWNKGKKTGKRPPRSELWKKKLSDSLIGRDSWCKGLKLSDDYRKKISSGRLKSIRENPNYKPSTSYVAIHAFLKRNHKRPKKCWWCGKECQTEWANMVGVYTRDVSNYRPLCRQCHMKYDQRFRRKLRMMFEQQLQQTASMRFGG